MTIHITHKNFMDLQKIARKSVNHVKENYQMFMAIAGMTGIGKSVFAIQLAKMIDPKFSYERNMLFAPTGQQIKEMAESLPKYAPIVLDEAVNTSYKHDWQKRESKELNKFTLISRVENKIFISCIPDFTDLSKHWRKITQFWFELIHRNVNTGVGTGVLHVQDFNYFKTDKWNMDKNAKLYDKSRGKKIISDFNLDTKLNLFKKCFNFHAFTQWDNLTEAEYEAYKIFKQAQKYARIKLEPELKPRAKRQQQDFYKALVVMREHGMSAVEISRIFNRSPKAIENIVSEVRKGHLKLIPHE